MRSQCPAISVSPRVSRLLHLRHISIWPVEGHKELTTQCEACNLREELARGSEIDFQALEDNHLPLDLNSFQQPAPPLPFYDPLLLTLQTMVPDIDLGVIPVQNHTPLMIPSAMPGSISGSSLLHPVPPGSYHLAPVVEPKLQKITASLWTSVPIDNHLMMELLSSYLQQGYLVSMPFQKDLFLKDLVPSEDEEDNLKEGRERRANEPKYCSPLLVNAILATAANTYRGGPRSTMIFNLASLTESFLAQAMHLWENEVLNEPKLTTIQAAHILSLYHIAGMRNDIGSQILSQAVAMATQMNLFTTNEDIWISTGMARAFTAWSLFSWQSTYCFDNLFRALVTEPPVTPLPDDAAMDELTGELRLGDLESQSTTPVYLGKSFRAMATFNVILNDVNLAFGGTGYFSTSIYAKQQVLIFCARLRYWFNSLPSELQNDRGEMSHLLRMHMVYHHTQSTMLGPWVGAGAHHLAGNRDAQGLHDLGAMAKIKLQSLAQVFHSKHGGTVDSHEQWVHAFLLGFLPRLV